MKSRFTTERKGAYVIHLSELKKLWTLLADRVGTVTLEANCVDEVQRTFNDWEDVQSYENASSKRIAELTFSAQSPDFDKSVSIDLSPRVDYTVRVMIACPENELSSLREDILDILDGMKHRILSYIVGRDIFLVIMFALFVIGIVNSLGRILLHETISGPETDVVTSIDSLILGFYAGVILVIIGYILVRLRAVLLPSIYFAIGQGESRYKNWKSRWGIALAVVSIIITVVVSVVAGVIF